MPTFSNMSDLAKYLGTSEGQKSIIMSKNIKSILTAEATRLKDCIQKRLDEYYNSYSPTVYNRTDMLKKALRLDDNVQVSVDGNSIQVTIFFDESSVTGTSLWSDTAVNKADLINYGWKVQKDVWFKDIEHFGYQHGFMFIEKGIADYNHSNKYGLKITVAGKRKKK